MTFHHIGIASKDIEETLRYIKSTYNNIKTISDIIYDPLQDANLCMVTLNDGVNIELVSGEQVSLYIKKRIQLYHTCWEVLNIKEAIDNHINNGAILISEPKKALLFNNRMVAFLLTDLGIIELLEK